MRKSGFTLIELLVVIAIIAILAAILFPVFAKAREKARQTACTNNQRQIVVAAQMWTQDHDEQFPEAAEFWGGLALDKGVLKCPSKARTANGYVYSNLVAGKAIGKFDKPNEEAMIADGQRVGAPASDPIFAPTVDNVAYETTDYAATRHSKKLIVAYLDGHVLLTSTVPAVSGLPLSPSLVETATFNSLTDYVTGTTAGQISPAAPWAYMTANESQAPSTATLLIWRAPVAGGSNRNGWGSASNDWLAVWNDTMHTGNPSSSSIQRWTNPGGAGAAHVKLEYTDGDTGDIKLVITKNDTELKSWDMNGTAGTMTFEQDVPIAAGDKLYFRVNPRGSYNGDSTRISVTITTYY